MPNKNVSLSYEDILGAVLSAVQHTKPLHASGLAANAHARYSQNCEKVLNATVNLDKLPVTFLFVCVFIYVGLKWPMLFQMLQDTHRAVNWDRGQTEYTVGVCTVMKRIFWLYHSLQESGNWNKGMWRWKPGLGDRRQGRRESQGKFPSSFRHTIYRKVDRRNHCPELFPCRLTSNRISCKSITFNQNSPLN